MAVVLLSVVAAVAVNVSVGQAQTEGDTYEQVVDNSDEGRFAASGSWKTSNSGEGTNGDDYRIAPPSEKSAHALFKVEIPADGEYTVYVRWPEVPGLNDSVPVGVQTAYGTEWTEMDQTRDGDLWVRVGEFEMRGGEEYPVRISRDTDGEGNVVADAVKVVQVSSYEGPEAALRPSPVPPSGGAATGASSAERQASAAASGGWQAVKEARRYLGTRYRYATCTRTQMSCTCLTRKTFAKFGYNLPMSEGGQFRYGKPVSKSRLASGDIVFFREGGGRLTHVGMVIGRDSRGDYWIIHASSYFGKVVESKMKYIRGYAGARRLV